MPIITGVSELLYRTVPVFLLWEVFRHAEIAARRLTSVTLNELTQREMDEFYTLRIDCYMICQIDISMF